MIHLVLRFAMLPYRDLGGAWGVSRCAATNSGWICDAEIVHFMAELVFAMSQDMMSIADAKGSSYITITYMKILLGNI